MTDLEILKAARELISDKSRWCQGYAAITKTGESILPESDEAEKWCAFGAIVRFGAPMFDGMWREALHLKSCELFDMPVASVNDELGHEAVMQVFDKTILQMEEYVD